MGLGRAQLLRLAALDGQGASAALNPLVRGSDSLDIAGNRSSALSGGSLKDNVTSSFDAGDLSEDEKGLQPSSWEDWLQHFDAMDELAEDAAHYQVEMNTAVRQERYGDAARHKRKLQEIQAADTVAAVQRQLQASLASEQYSSAAGLRDAGLVGLAGWWAGKAGTDDFSGHLLHVKPEFGRWTGRVYMARDIAQMNGWRENKLMQLLDRASGGGSRAGSSGLAGLDGAGGLGGGTIGTPLMEVFVRQLGGAGASSSGGGNGGEQQLNAAQLVHQAVALRPPAPKGAEKGGAKGSVKGASGSGSSNSSSATGSAGSRPALDPASVVRLCIHVTSDGSARISVLPPQKVQSRFSGWEEEEMRATMAALAGNALKPQAPSTASAARAAAAAALDSDEEEELDGFRRAVDSDDEDDVLTELTRVPAQVALQGRDRFTFTVTEEGGSGTSAGGGDEAEGSSVDLPRWAAVPIDDDDSSGDEAELASATARRGSGSGVVEVEVEVVEGAEGTDRRSMLEASDDDAAAATEVDDEDEAERSLRVSYDMLSSGYGTVDAVATSVSDDEEQRIVIEIPVGRLVRQQQRAEEEARRASGAATSSSSSSDDAPASSSASARRGKDTFDRLAERVSQLQAARVGRPVPPHNLASALRDLAKRLLAGELQPDGSSSATATVPATQQPSSPHPSSAASVATATVTKPGATRITYSRIPTDLPRSDPFTGLYLGAFGPHGPELISLSRSMVDGEEWVTAHKVTGDPNVPAGEVSFRAKIGRRHRLASRDVYPDELGITARYKGEGRVAMGGYKSPRWVDGELLVFAVGASPVTSGAELGFVWSVPGEKRFLILLNKLDLKECEK